MLNQEILNYRITKVIGQGGMGTVYLAVNKFIEEQRVAIKVINANMLNDFTRKRLEEEAHRLAELNHANIVRLINFHVDSKGSVYLIMEYTSGYTIEKYVKEINGLIVEEKICPIFEPILEGIGYAHKHGIIHCDIKPSNIMIDIDGVPKILDFGIAQIVNKDENASTVKMIMGTPSYMSPEQVEGRVLDARSDIYSLGVMLHVMLTGSAPYDTTTMSEQDIFQKVVIEPLPRMATFYKYVSDKLQKIVDKATAKNPNERYQTCEEFKHALHEAIIPSVTPKWIKITAAAIAILFIGVGTYIWDYNRIKVSYYKDYTLRWSVPEGIGELSSSEHSRINRSYMFVKQKGRLIRVAHVNSFDNPIEDDETERMERPIDQEFTFTESGKLSSIKIKGANGKVLGVKSYNEKLNVMTFQYDDEHNTECIMANSINSVDIAEDRGHISRHWIEYDENGFQKSIRYYSMDSSPTHNKDGIYGEDYILDEKGRVIELHYVGLDSKPKAKKCGLGIKKFDYDENDNMICVSYLTTDGQSIINEEDGIVKMSLIYDENSNVVKRSYLDAEDNLMLSKSSFAAGQKYKYDEQGLEKQSYYFGIDGKPAYNVNDGVSIYSYKYDKNGFLSKQTNYDASGSITYCNDGWSVQDFVNDDRGNIIESWYRNSDGSLCLTIDGYGGFKDEYDEFGNRIKSVKYGTDKMPIASDGYAGLLLSYNSKGFLVEETNLGVDLKPAVDNEGITITRFEYDNRGNRTKMIYYEADGITIASSYEGISGLEYVFDEIGNITKIMYFDKLGNPVMSQDTHLAFEKYTYDENNNLKSIRHYNSKGKLTLIDGVAGYDFVNDKNGNVLEMRPIGSNGSPSTNHNWMKSKYDSNNNVIEKSFYIGSVAAKDNNNVHRYVYVYNSRNQIEEIRFYAKNGKLTLGGDEKVSIIKIQYDSKGKKVYQTSFGVDEKPCSTAEGWCSSSYEYDVYGNVIKQSFFDKDGKPMNSKQMYAAIVYKYDNRKNKIFIAVQNEDGEFINFMDKKWSIWRREYDLRNNIISESFYSTDDKPINMAYGYHIEKFYYDEKFKLAKTELFDKNDKPVNCSAGFQKIVFTYGIDGVPTTRKYYSKSNSLIKTERYNKITDDWETYDEAREINSRNSVGSSTAVWQNNVRSYALTCPIDIGNNIKITSINYTSNSVTVILKFYVLSKSDIEENISRKTLIVFKTKLREELGIPVNVSLVINVLDKAGNKVYAI